MGRLDVGEGKEEGRRERGGRRGTELEANLKVLDGKPAF